MARRGLSPLTDQIRRTLAAHARAERTGVPVEEILERACSTELSRRDLLRRAGVVGASGAVLAAGLRPRAARAAAAPSVVVVGAGLAGVRAAHWLYRVKGIDATVYEASTRVGGRCWSLRDYFDDGVVVEHGGQLINTDHNTIRNLVNSLGLKLVEVNGGAYQGWVDRYWIDGADYPYDAANADWGQVWSAMKAALQSAPYVQTYDANTPAGIALDHMTVDEWLDANVPGGLSSRFAKLMQGNVVAEYGMDSDQQSALNLVYLLGWNAQNSLDPVNGSDERFAVEGGNDQIVSRMLDELPAGTVKLDHALTAVRANAGGTVTCTFQRGNRAVDVTADRVVLALPFTTLRDCDLSRSGFSPLKLRAIDELGLGYNAKIHVQLSSRPWVATGYGGTAYTNQEGFQCGWDDTSWSTATKGVFVFFPGGRQVQGWRGQAFGPGSKQEVASYLDQGDAVFPGMKAAYTGKSWRDAWIFNPWSKGAYTCQQPGQYTSVFGVGSVREGNVFFAGEHTSTYYWGYLNGAVESGERAAKEVSAS
jgi:monoamine oxidase